MKTVKLAKASGIDDADNDVRAAIEFAITKLCSRQSAPMLRSGCERAAVISAVNDAVSAATDAASYGQALEDEDSLAIERREHIREHAKNARKEIRILKQWLARRPSNPLPAVGGTTECENTIISEQIATDAESNPDQSRKAQIRVQRLLDAEESLEELEKLFGDAGKSATRRLSQNSSPDRDTLVNELALIWTAATGCPPPACKSADTPFYDFCAEILHAEGILKFDQSIASVRDRLDRGHQRRLKRALVGFYEPWGL